MTKSVYDIIRTPVVTEKSTMMSEHNRVVFKVAPDANKDTIKKAVEELYGVKVKAVNTINVMGKTKHFRGRPGTRNSYKKAIVTLEQGQMIDVMAGVK